MAAAMTPASSAPSRVLIVDDEQDLRENLLEWLTLSGYDATGAEHAQAALALARREHFDVVVTDLKMPGMNGIDLLRLYKEISPATEVIVLTGYASLEVAIRALKHGRAFDFLQKPLADLDALNVVIEQALAKRHRGARTEPPAPAPAPEPTAGLSERERQILDLLVTGLDNKQMASRLAISDGTLRNQLSVLYEKLGVTNRTQAALAWRVRRS